MKLSEFARQYFASRVVSPVYADTVKRRAAALESFAGCTAIDRVLTEAVVNGFLRRLTGSPYTIRSYRSDILSLWNAAADLDLLPYPVMRRIWQPTCPALLVECFALDEVRKILAAAARAHGVYPGGVRRAEYWDAAIRLGWDSGLRRSDVWQFNRQHLRPDGVYRCTQRKTGAVVTVRLRPTTVAAIDRIGGQLAWRLDPSFFGRHFASLVRESKVCRGTFKWLRRSCGSYCEAQQPGSGHRQLGNGPGVFARNYDAKLGGPTWPAPPEL